MSELRYREGSRKGVGGRPSNQSKEKQEERDKKQANALSGWLTGGAAAAPPAPAQPAAAAAGLAAQPAAEVAAAAACSPAAAESPRATPSPSGAAADGAAAHAAAAVSSSEDDEPLSKRFASGGGLPAAVRPLVLTASWAKLKEFRQLLDFLTRRHFVIGKQAGLAQHLGVTSNWMSEFKTGRGSMGLDLSVQELLSRRRNLLGRLQLHGLPTALPPADQPLEGASGSPSTRCAAPAPVTTHAAGRSSLAGRPRLPAARPVLAVDLAEAPGSQGGMCYIMAIGTPPPAEDPRWRMTCPARGMYSEAGETAVLELRRGLRGRRTLGTSSVAGGRTFEWHLEVIDDPAEISCHGGPLFVAVELTSATHALSEQMPTTRIIGRRVSTGGGHTGPSSPELMWAAIGDYCGVGVRFSGIRQCGFIHRGVQALLGAAAAPPSHAALPYGSRKGLENLNPTGSWLREFGAIVGDQFMSTMDELSPGKPEFAFKQLLACESWRKRFLPADMQAQLDGRAVRKAVLDTPFVQTFVHVYHTLSGFKAKRQHLSMFAPHFPWKVTQETFGVSEHLVYRARLHAAGWGAGRPVPQRIVSFRITPEQGDELLRFANNADNVQILASSKNKSSLMSVGLKQRRERLWRKYYETTAPLLRVGRSRFLAFFSTPRVFHTLRATSCLCGPCLEHGIQAFKELADTITDLGAFIGSAVCKTFLGRAEHLRDYFGHEYMQQCQVFSPVATQCITLGLCGTGKWFSPCTHGGHEMNVPKENELWYLIEDLRAAVHVLQTGPRPPSLTEVDWTTRLLIIQENLETFEYHVHWYMAHLLRKALSGKIATTLLERLRKESTAMHLTVDHKQKLLVKKHHEAQSEGFGKRGLSIFGAMAMRWDEKSQSFLVLHVRVACDDANQDWYQTAGGTRASLDQVVASWPDITSMTLQSDGASNLSCTAFCCVLPRLCKAGGVRLDQHAVTEVGGGKTKEDTDFVSVRTHIKNSNPPTIRRLNTGLTTTQHAQVSRDCNLAVDGGLDVTNATEIVTALELHPTKGSINVAMSLDRLQQPTGKAVKPFKGIGDYYHREFEWEGDTCVAVLFRKFFQLGEGLRAPMPVLRALWRSEEELDAAADGPVALLRTAGSTRKAVPKLAESEQAAALTKKKKQAKKNAKLQREFVKAAEEGEKEQQRLEEAKSFRCRFHALGCRHDVLSAQGAKKHADLHCPFRPDAPHPPTQPRVRLWVSSGRAGRKSCRLSLSTAPDGNGGFSVRAKLVGTSASTGRGVLTHMRVERALVPARAYGLHALLQRDRRAHFGKKPASPNTGVVRLIWTKSNGQERERPLLASATFLHMSPAWGGQWFSWTRVSASRAACSSLRLGTYPSCAPPPWSRNT
jgi:hypothetical protein